MRRLFWRGLTTAAERSWCHHLKKRAGLCGMESRKLGCGGDPEGDAHPVRVIDMWSTDEGVVDQLKVISSNSLPTHQLTAFLRANLLFPKLKDNNCLYECVCLCEWILISCWVFLFLAKACYVNGCPKVWLYFT